MDIEAMKETMIQTFLSLDAKGQVVAYAPLFQGLSEAYPDLSREQIHEFLTNNVDEIISVIEAQRLIN